MPIDTRSDSDTITRRQLAGALQMLEQECRQGTFQTSEGPERFTEIADFIFRKVGK